jgi:hypothetical protein
MQAFDFVNAASYGKQDLIRESDNPELAEKTYTPFLTNKAFSQYVDTILYANEMNMRSQLDNQLAFDYYLNSIRPQKRFAKWAKKSTSDDLEVVKDYYQYNYEKAEHALSLLSKEQLIELKKRLEKGGKS